MENKNLRVGLYRKIEVARKQLPYMDEEAFREMLRTQFGVESRKDMTIHQLSSLVSHFVTLGVRFTAPAKAKKYEALPQSRTDWIEITDSMFFAAEKRQILAIWRKLGYDMNSLNTRVKRAFGCPVFIWLNDEKQVGILLSDLQRREKAFDARADKQ